MCPEVWARPATGTRLSLAMALVLALLLPGARPATAIAADGGSFRPAFTLDAPLRVDHGAGHDRASAIFRLPPDAAQGPTSWYVLSVTVALELQPAAPVGSRSYVSVQTNGFAAGQIALVADRVGELPVVRWSSLDLFGGAVEGIVVGRTLTLPFRNYLQIQGVRHDENELALVVEHLGDIAVVSAAQLLPGSGIAAGPLAPPALRLEAAPPDRRIRFGDAFTLEYRVTSRGYPTREISIGARVPGAGLAALEPPDQFIDWVGGAEAVRTLHLRALRPGRHELILTARGVTGGRTPPLIIPIEVATRGD